MADEINNENNVEYLNQYIGVLNDNLTHMIKQNVVIQTNLQITEKNLAFMVEKDKQNTEVMAQARNLINDNRRLEFRISELESVASSHKNLADERTRLQVALNEISQEKNKLVSDFNSLQQEVLRLRSKADQFDKLKVESKTTPVENKKEIKQSKSKTVENKSSTGTF